MVNIAGVVPLTVPKLKQYPELSVDHAVLIPTWWLLTHCLERNLEMTKSVEDCLLTGKMSERIFAEVILDFADKTYSYLLPYIGLVVSLNDGSIVGLKGQFWNVNVMFAGKSVVLPIGMYELNQDDHGTVRNSTAPATYARELSDNRSMMRYFNAKLPIRLKRYTVTRKLSNNDSRFPPVVTPRRLPSLPGS